jgi:hypothetical protein
MLVGIITEMNRHGRDMGRGTRRKKAKLKTEIYRFGF